MIQRYDCTNGGTQWCQGCYTMTPDNNGDYVRFDAHEAELAALRIENDTLRAELESAHAAQRHAEKELSQYVAWYAMAEHQHLHEQRRAEKAEAERAAALVAVKAMHKLLDRDCAIVDRDITLKCESHDQAWNYLHEMRDLVRAALAQEGEG